MYSAYIAIYFTLYSFAGWIIEVIYRSWTRRGFVNPGFLHGPFVPIYGIGAVLVILFYRHVAAFPLPLQFVIFGLMLSFIEYAAGEFFERVFHLTLWDYNDGRFNFRGKISLPFSLAWAGLALVLAHLLHPLAASAVRDIREAAAVRLSILAAVYFAADFSLSVVSLQRFRRSVSYLYDRYVTLNNGEVQNIILSFRRILGAFPNLNKYLHSSVSDNLMLKVGAVMGRLSETLDAAVRERKPREKEYAEIVKDIVGNREFLRLKEFFHHNSSIYEHARIVSYLSYRICKYLDLDYTAAARGGMLHDFFTYDWRNHDVPDLPREKFHGLEHPRIALENSLKHFKLNDMEKDIIIKHMWPLTFFPPRYKESFIVTFVDKYVSSREFIDEFIKARDNVKEKRSRRKHEYKNI